MESLAYLAPADSLLSLASYRQFESDDGLIDVRIWSPSGQWLEIAVLLVDESIVAPALYGRVWMLSALPVGSRLLLCLFH